MIHPDTELRYVNERLGLGVFATRDIPRGTITWVQDALDQVFSPAEVQNLAEPYQHILRKYAYTNRQGQIVLCWDHARFVNHACEAVCLMSGFGFEIATRDLHAGEELTDDYGLLNLRNAFSCACGSPTCRKWLQPQDFVRCGDRWDDLLRGSVQQIPTVPQPLWWLLDQADEVLAASRDPSRLPTCQSLRATRPA
ncbi:MAG: SET domain-containing protein-lysine N-methyltransferase [Planctomycetes bacterium]|nr:SET domain-containing protein-lysine N-methyltransferase [Planctomycetota bacterium]